MILDLQTIPKLNSLFKLQFEKVQDCYVLLYPEGMIKLNKSASTILNFCDSKNTVLDIIENIKKTLDEDQDIKDDIIDFLQQAYEKKWLI